MEQMNIQWKFEKSYIWIYVYMLWLCVCVYSTIKQKIQIHQQKEREFKLKYLTVYTWSSVLFQTSQNIYQLHIMTIICNWYHEQTVKKLAFAVTLLINWFLKAMTNIKFKIKLNPLV